MSIIFKRSHYSCGLRSEILLAAIKLEPLFAAIGLDLVVTSGAENYKHSAKRSAHYRGDAVDLRSKHVPETINKIAFMNEFKKILGDDYVVIFENENTDYEHYHIHWSAVFKGV